MKKTLQPQKEYKEQYAVHPHKLMMWIAIVAIAMMFAGLTSAYIVKKADPRGAAEFRLPFMFFVTTIIVLLSSFTLWMASKAAKNDEIGQSKLFTLATLVLGLAFCGGQYLAWSDMVAHKMFFSDTNVLVSFVYALTWLHFAHIIGGIVALVVLFYKTTKFQVHKKNMITMNLVSTYWHFVGFLWVYLFVFLTYA